MQVTFGRYRFLVHGTDDDEVVVTMCFELIYRKLCSNYSLIIVNILPKYEYL